MTGAPTPHVSRRRLLLGGSAAIAGAGLAPRMSFAQAPIKTAGVYTQPVTQTWTSPIHVAAKAAQAAGQIDYSFAEEIAPTEYPRVMRDYAEAGVKLMIGDIFDVEQDARKVAADFPDVAFLMGSSQRPSPAIPNLAVFDNSIHDASYLTGIIAGAMTTTGTIGMVGGFAIPRVNRLMQAFMLGVREMRPDASFKVRFIDSWFDPPKARETALAMIDSGADVLYADSTGVTDAAQERGVLAIGNMIDTQPENPDTVVATALWHFGPTLEKAVQNVRDTRFAAADYRIYSFMKNGGCSLAPLGTFEGRLPQAAMTRLNERREAVKAGEYLLPMIDEEPKSS